jgi:dTDP-4-dehydrorhamnose 3,5-epimerase
MKFSETKLRDALIIDPTVHGDDRGFFFEGFNRHKLFEATGYEFNAAQANHSRSSQHILRGLHYQVENVQAKLIWATSGSIFDVIVDLRRSSPSFGKWTGVELSSDNRRRFLVPEGFAHGFLVLSESAEITYLTSDIYNPTGERFLRWNCPKLGIAWPVSETQLNERDATAPGFSECETYA